MLSSPVKGDCAGPLAARAVRIAPQHLVGAAPTDEEEAIFLENDGSLRIGHPDMPACACSGGRKACMLLLSITAILLILHGARASSSVSARRSGRTVELEGEALCHTALDGEECYTLVSWIVKVTRQQGNADWGGLGVTSSSTREEVQQALHLSEEESVCPRPCGGGDSAEGVPDMPRSTSTTTATTTVDVKYMQDKARATALILATPTPDPHAAAAETDFEKGEAAYKAAENEATAAHALAGPGGRMQAPAAVSANGCGVVQDMVYLPGNDLHTIPNVSRPEDCCKACTQAADCVAWTWGRRLSESSSVLPHGAHLCYLKGSKPRVTLSRVFDPDFTSGWTTPAVKPGSITTQWPMDRASLLCASQLSSSGLSKEAARRLVALQYSMQTSIFACDEYMVFAVGDERPVAPGVWPVQLAEPEGQTGGGSWARSGGKEVNDRMVVLDVKLLFWRSLIQSNRYRFHDWTVKVDPQTVFIPGRFRTRIRHHDDDPPTGTQVSTCEDHPSHALEVLSQMAVDAWSMGWEHCLDFFAPQASINQSREEVLVDRCLGILQAKRDTDAYLLSSPECMEAVDCSNVKYTAYHEFGTEESYRQCLQQSSSSVR